MKPIVRSKRKPAAPTPGERLFEAYLRGLEIPYKYEHEHKEDFPGRKKSPDFLVRWNGTKVICDVKDTHRRRECPTGGAMFDPYLPIRKKIDKARRQFREYKDSPCVLVLYNVNDWEFRDDPQILYGAMLGDLGFTVPVMSSATQDVARSVQEVLLNNGRMWRHGEVRNTTFSAIAVLSEFEVPNRAYYEERSEAWARIPRGLNPSERLERQFEWAKCNHRSRILRREPRCVVVENPSAAIPLETTAFSGPYDERYRFVHDEREGSVQRVFLGEGVRSAGALLHANSDIFDRIEQFKNEIVRLFSPQEVILFGSHARGTAMPDSDVDLLVVFPGGGDRSDMAREILGRCPRDFPLDLLTYSARALEHRRRLGDDFVREVLDTGRVLHP
jgi:uncharacterized protein